MPYRLYDLQDRAESAIHQFIFHKSHMQQQGDIGQQLVTEKTDSYDIEKHGKVVAQYFVTATSFQGQTHIRMDYKNAEGETFISYNPGGPAEVLLDNKKNVIAEIFSDTAEKHKELGLVI